MLLGRIFTYADAHRYRIGTNYKQLPVNAPQGAGPHYSKDGADARTSQRRDDPVYAPNSVRRPAGRPARYRRAAGWQTDGDMVRPLTRCTPRTLAMVSHPDEVTDLIRTAAEAV